MNKNRNVLIICIAIFAFLIYNLSGIFHGVGKFLYNGKFYNASEVYLHSAVLIKPDDPEFRYDYMLTLEELSPTYKVQKAVCEIAYGDTEDPAQRHAAEQITQWKKNIKDQYGETYIEQTPMDSRVLRWDKSSFPLKVYTDKNGLEIPEYYKSSIASAFSQWDKSIDFIGFETSKDKNDADIIIQFKQIPDNACTENGCRYVVGFTTPTIKGDSLKKMTIVIYDQNPNKEFFSDKEIYNTVLHELGHALGIMGHSYSTDDLMYQNAKEQSSVWAKFRSEFQYITGKDVNTIKLLYTLIPDITNERTENEDVLIYAPVILGSQKDITNKKLKEALNYIDVSPTISVGYINLANAYAELKEHNKAIEALNKALTLSPSDDERYIIYYNLASVYANIGHQNTALKYAELAKKIKSTEEILELISIIKVRK